MKKPKRESSPSRACSFLRDSSRRGWTSASGGLRFPILIVVRIRNEEAVLTQGLAGYEDYKRKVRYRLIPFIW